MPNFILYPNAFVVTGPMSSGKTATLRDIRRQTLWRIMRETARTVITMRKRAGMTDPYDSTLDQEIYNRNVIKEPKRLKHDGVVVLDRGILDAIAYARTFNQSLQLDENVIHRQRYRGVFLLDPLPFKDDGVRPDWEKDAQPVIMRNLTDVYTEYGYDIVQVPVASIVERTDLIVGKMREILAL